MTLLLSLLLPGQICSDAVLPDRFELSDAEITLLGAPTVTPEAGLFMRTRSNPDPVAGDVPEIGDPRYEVQPPRLAQPLRHYDEIWYYVRENREIVKAIVKFDDPDPVTLRPRQADVFEFELAEDAEGNLVPWLSSYRSVRLARPGDRSTAMLHGWEICMTPVIRTRWNDWPVRRPEEAVRYEDGTEAERVTLAFGGELEPRALVALRRMISTFDRIGEGNGYERDADYAPRLPDYVRLDDGIDAEDPEFRILADRSDEPFGYGS